MDLILFLILFSSIVYSVEQAKKEWRHHRDGYARQIKRGNPDWHPRKVHRHARRRAITWWAMEAARGFPTIRHAWAEDRDHVRYLRETDRIGRETRHAELRAELEAIRRGRDEHEAATRAGRTRLAFGPWYQQQAPRIRQAEPDPAAEPEDRPAGAPPPIEEARRAPASTNGSVPSEADAGERPQDHEPERPSEIGHAGASGAGVAANGAPAGSTGGEPAAAPSRTQAADDFYAAITEGRHAEAEAAHQTYQATRPDNRQTGDRVPEAPVHQAGKPNRDNDNEGDGMDTNVPNGELAGDSPYRAAFTALEQYDQVAQQHEQSAETLEAQMTMHGFDRDPQLMEHIHGLRETATQIRTRTASARQTLTANHAQGDEYHRSGVDANASAFRHS